MATLNDALQSMVDDFHAKMISDEPMTAEEQTLIATAIEKLTNQVDLERALIAVASDHLNSATQSLSQSLATADNSLAATLSTSSEAATKLTQATQALSGFNACIPRTLISVKHIEVPGVSVNNVRAQSVFAVYDASGKSYLVRPSYAEGATNQSCMLQHLSLADSGMESSVLGFHHVTTSQFYTEPTTHIYKHGMSAIVPLASKTDPNSIEYDVLYSTQSEASDAPESYKGIYVKSAGIASITLPKKDIDAVDQWGLRSNTSHQWDSVSVLYNNLKHCVVMVDSATNRLVEKYRDGNVLTDIDITDSSALQTLVDNGNYTVVSLIAHHLAWVNASQVTKVGVSTSLTSNRRDHFGFFGKLGEQVQMGGSAFSAHYRFTDSKILEPVNFVFSSAVSPSKPSDSTGTQASEADVTVVLSDFSGNTLGSYAFTAKADHAGQETGYHGNSVMCLNPFSRVGIINEIGKNVEAQTYFGIGRTCRAY